MKIIQKINAILICFSLFTVYQSQAQCHIDDWTALKAVYDNSNINELILYGGNWGLTFSNANSPRSNCDLNILKGVQTNGNGRVSELDIIDESPMPFAQPPIGFLRYMGSLPTEIGLLSELETLSFPELTGNIPRSISNLTKLKKLKLSAPNASPDFIALIENFNQLTHLDLSRTNINGNIPSFIFDLSNLEELNLYQCNLTGNISGSIGNLTKLTSLNLERNRLSGSIPETIGNLTQLRTLNISSNLNLTGPIPLSLGNLTELKVLSLFSNSLSGCFDPNLANLCLRTTLWYDTDAFEATWEDFCASASGVCNTGENITFGCRNPNACNYDLAATYTNNSICEFPMLNCDCSNINGCMDANAMNYNPNADCNDGTCEYDNTIPPGDYNITAGRWNTALENTCNTLSFEVIVNTTNREISFNADGRLSVDLRNTINGIIKIRTQGGNNCQAEWTFNLSPNNCVESYSLYQPWLNRMIEENNCSNFEVDLYRFKTISDVINPPDKVYVRYGNSGTLYGISGNFLCSDFVNDTITDCLASLELASNNFWSCTSSSGGCTDPTANNYNPNAACNNGSCAYEDDNQNGGNNNNDEIFTSYPWLSTFADPITCNGESIIVYDAGSYNFILIQDGNEGKLYFENGAFYCNETPTYSCVATYNLSNVAQTWTCGNIPIISGCTDATAINYNSNATEDDGSCEYKNSNTSPCNLNDWNALKALYENTNGDNWVNNTGWAEVKGNQPTPACNLELLFGVETDASGRVTELDLPSNQLNGTIPSELSDLSSLRFLNLTGNQLRGSIPASLGNLNNLFSLDLSVNQLSGNIPASLGNLSNLTKLILFINQLSGSIPSELGNLNKLDVLYLDNNQLSGNIPSELSNLVNLTELNLNANQLSGSIPAELGNLSNLIFLGLAFNQLSGNIPSELGSLSNLEILALGDNQLSGNIPVQLGNLSSLENLILDNNQLSGSIPVELSNLNNLVGLFLSDNQLSGNFPSELVNLSNLTALGIRDNNFNGCYPQVAISLCTQLNGRFFVGNRDISNGNNFDATWDDFCENSNGVCTGNNVNQSEIFNIYPWLSTYINESNCTNESITVYDAGSYNFILIQNGNEGKLYFENGIYYCDETPNYSCVDAYGLNNVAQTWSCGNSNTPISGCTNSNAINYNPTATVDDGSCEYENTGTCNTNTGTFFYADCGGISYYFIRLDDGRVFDPYFAEGIGITPREGQQIHFDYVIKTDVTTPCTISESPITITCFEEIKGTLFDDYTWLSTQVNQNNCSNESITVYDAGSYNFIYIQTQSGNSLYYQNGTFYCKDVPGYSCVAAYNLTNVANTWNCGGNQNHKQSESNAIHSNKTIQVKTSFKLYPNPAKRAVFVEPHLNSSNETKYQISIIDISGKVMKQIETNKDESIIKIEVEDLPRGMYMVEFKNEDTSNIQKLIVE